MQMHIEPPKRKVNSYVSRITTDGGAPVCVRVDDAKIVQKQTVDNGTLLRVWIPKSNPCYQLLQDIDGVCLKEILENNNKWFNNDLTESCIKNYFRTTIDSNYSTLVVLRSDEREPIILVDNDPVDTIDDSFEEVSLDIETQGLYFYNTKCGVKWILKKLVLRTTDDITLDRAEIQEQWRRDIEEMQVQADEDCRHYAQKTAEFISSAKQLLAEMHACVMMDDVWAQKCKNLSQVFKGYNKFKSQGV